MRSTISLIGRNKPMSDPYPAQRPKTILLDVEWVEVDDENTGGVAVDKDAMRQQLEDQLSELEQEWGAV